MKTTPCADPKRDPNDWFIESYGKQYREDELLDEAERSEIAWTSIKTHLPLEEVQKRLDLAASEKKRQALIRRRKARDSCREECPARKACLAKGLLQPNLDYGTWGGYFAEERREIDKLRQAREIDKLRQARELEE